MENPFIRSFRAFIKRNPEHKIGFILIILSIIAGVIYLPMENSIEDCGGTYKEPEIAMDSEYRGLWVVRTSMKSKESIEEVIDRASMNNFNFLLVQVNGRGEAYYESDIIPKVPGVPEDFDPLAFCIERAHAVGIDVHAWINAFTVGELGRKKYQENHVLTQHPEWCLVDSDSVSTFDYTHKMAKNEIVSIMLDPAIEGVKEYVRKVFMDVITKYDVDGVHFDYIRYPGKTYGYSKVARQMFKDLTGYDPIDIVKAPETFRNKAVDGKDLLGNINNEWDEFRRDQVTETVRRVYSDIKKIKPHIAVSCAVLPDINDSYNRKMQDWQKWIEEDIVDFIVPMVYTPDTHEFTTYMESAVEPFSGERVLAGVGVYRMLDNPMGCIEKIETARELGTSGIVLFSYDSIKDKADYWEALVSGPFESPAVTPVMAPSVLNKN